MPSRARFRWRSAPREALAAANRRRNELRHALRVMAAVGGAFALSLIFQMPQGGYWAIFTAVLVVQASVGATLAASRERFLGAVVGGGVGVLASVAAGAAGLDTAIQHGLVLCGVVAFLSFLAAVRPVLKVAPVIAVISLIATPGALATWEDSLLRALEVMIGGVMGVAATLLVFPARANVRAVERLASTLIEIAGLIDLEREGLEGIGRGEVGFERHRSVREALAEVEQSMDEAGHEHAAWLAGEPASEALLRTVWRARTDCVGIEHALSAISKGPALDHVRPSAIALLSAHSARLRLSAQALLDERTVERGALLAADASFDAAVTEARESGQTLRLSTDEAAGLLGLVFTMSSLTTNLEDLADRIDEMAGQTPP